MPLAGLDRLDRYDRLNSWVFIGLLVLSAESVELFHRKLFLSFRFEL
jgi:hypothetical protein